MNPQDTVDLSREALTMVATLGGPILFVGVIIGLVVGVLQAMTQVQDQTVSTVPKLAGMLIAGIIFLPWISDRMVTYTRDSLQRPLIGATPVAFQSDQNQSPSNTVATSTAATPVVRVATSDSDFGFHHFSASTNWSSSASVAAPPVPPVIPTPRTSSMPTMPTLRLRKNRSMPMLMPQASPGDIDSQNQNPLQLPSFQRRIEGRANGDVDVGADVGVEHDTGDERLAEPTELEG